MALMWAVPVVAMAIATAILAVVARPLGEEVAGLVDDVHTLDEVGRRLAVVRTELSDSEAMGTAFARRHATARADGAQATTERADGAV